MYLARKSNFITGQCWSRLRLRHLLPHNIFGYIHCFVRYAVKKSRRWFLRSRIYINLHFTEESVCTLKLAQHDSVGEKTLSSLEIVFFCRVLFFFFFILCNVHVNRSHQMTINPFDHLYDHKRIRCIQRVVPVLFLLWLFLFHFLLIFLRYICFFFFFFFISFSLTPPYQNNHNSWLMRSDQFIFCLVRIFSDDTVIQDVKERLSIKLVTPVPVSRMSCKFCFVNQFDFRKERMQRTS